MALKPENEKHAGQIAAGTKGRNKGHKFEGTLTEAINSIDFSKQKLIEGSSNLVVGNPAVMLVSYVAERLALKNVKAVKAWWVGGLATSGQGDVLVDESGKVVDKCKSDIVIRITTDSKVVTTGVSVKTCSKATPTNAQLYFTTAQAFCRLLRDNGVEVSEKGENALRMFCGDMGYRPMDTMAKEEVQNRKSDTERWFWEELPIESREELEGTFSKFQDKITSLLLQKAYRNDPFAPDFVLHQTVAYEDFDHCPIALFTIKELVDYSHRYGGFSTNTYKVKKGRFKGDPNLHHAPRFGYVQFQRGGQKQHPTQLQFNLQAGYFNKLPV